MQQQQPVQQYTITLDGKTLKSNQIHYKIEPTGTITIQEPQYVQQVPSTPAQHQTTTIRYMGWIGFWSAIDILMVFFFLKFQQQYIFSSE